MLHRKVGEALCRNGLWLQSLVSSTRFSSTTESSLFNSPASTLDRLSHSLPHSVGPSRRRCISHITSIPLSIPASGALSLIRADPLPPRKRFRDSYSSKDSIKEDIDVNVLVDIEADATAVEATADIDVEVRFNACIGIEVGIEREDEDEYEAESSDREEQHEALRHHEDEESESRQVLTMHGLYG
nr:hypothetical protein [Tanacetum cinerariifolium]